ALLVGASFSTLLREKLRLAELGIPHVLLDSSEGRVARNDAEALRRGGPLVVLVTSEVLGRAEVQSALERSEFGAVAIDSAELAADRGHEVRPSFGLLPARLQVLGSVSRFAFSRPVPSEVRKQAGERLGFGSTVVLEGALVDPAVRLESRAVRGERRNATLVELLPSLPERGVILCATPHEVDGLCAVLGKEHGSVCRVHAAMPAADRHVMRERFDAEKGRALLVTTSALGPDVGIPGLGESALSEPRVGFGADTAPGALGFVLHHHAPASLEQYVRELAWLRSADAVSLVFYDSSHRSMNGAILEQARLPSQKLEPFARALESTLAAGRPLKPEALALQAGTSRRTSERMLALWIDAGLARRDKGTIVLEKTPAERAGLVDALARTLQQLEHDDAKRLAAVERYAESNECKRRALAQYFGRSLEPNCGSCSSCRPRAAAERQAHAR
ncbi:MAG TPA: RecQ family zinc-binding domain-containing protein, partial [Polyangiaceae bacterium]|nr:RecQ family zinc-binding domain-containing protein [Polyangiaceae bacterium]